MATILHSFFFFSFLLLFIVDARLLPKPLPENEPQKQEKSVMNIEVDREQDPNVPKKHADEFKAMLMLASGSFAVNEKNPVAEHRYRRSFPVNYRNSRSGKIVSARWIDGTTLHQLDAVTIPDFVDGERMMVREFRNPRFVFLRNLRRRKHQKNGLGHFIWRKLRNFLINL